VVAVVHGQLPTTGGLVKMVAAVEAAATKVVLLLAQAQQDKATTVEVDLIAEEHQLVVVVAVPVVPVGLLDHQPAALLAMALHLLYQAPL
jgi:hypothetical protein